MCRLIFWVAVGMAFATAAQAYDIEEYGAVHDPDGERNARSFIQDAINDCHRDGGGTVTVPAGTYHTGALRLRSNVTLHLENGARLVASEHERDYFRHSTALIVAEDVENIAITGFGEIVGQGDGDYGKRYGVEEYDRYRHRVLEISDSRAVQIVGIRIRYSPSWAITIEQSENVFLERVTIRNNLRHLTSDGIDLLDCRNVVISNCRIVAGDDAICLKDGAENIIISNCILETHTTGFKIGTQTEGEFRSIHASNLTIDAPTGIGFYMKDGGLIEAVTLHHITIRTPTPDDVNRPVVPVFMDIERRHDDSPLGRIRDVSLSAVAIYSGSSGVIQGTPDRPIENVSLENVTLRVQQPDSYEGRRKPIGGIRTAEPDVPDTLFFQKPTYFAFAHVNGLRLRAIRLRQEEAGQLANERTAFEVFESTDVLIDGDPQ